MLTRPELEATGKLEEFVKLVSEGGAVGALSLREKLPKAERVAILEREGKVVAAAAKKKPIPGYIVGISQHSGYQLPTDIPELGYVAVSSNHRGQGLSGIVVRRILFEFGNATVFATTSDNTMRLVLAHTGFEWVGHEWDSIERPGEELSLWVKRGRQ